MMAEFSPIAVLTHQVLSLPSLFTRCIAQISLDVAEKPRVAPRKLLHRTGNVHVTGTVRQLPVNKLCPGNTGNAVKYTPDFLLICLKFSGTPKLFNSLQCRSKPE